MQKHSTSASRSGAVIVALGVGMLQRSETRRAATSLQNTRCQWCKWCLLVSLTDNILLDKLAWLVLGCSSGGLFAGLSRLDLDFEDFLCCPGS